MNITIYRHQEYSKFIVTIENDCNIQNFTLYDVTLKELGEFIAGIMGEEK